MTKVGSEETGPGALVTAQGEVSADRTSVVRVEVVKSGQIPQLYFEGYVEGLGPQRICWWMECGV